jgi:hypothetical protein
MAELTATERATLAQCEREIDAGRRAWVATGRALRTVRDAKLYREGFGTFDEYIAQRWKMHPRTAYRLMDGEAVFNNLAPGPDFEHVPEKQLRPLTKLDPEQQREAWTMACAAAPKDDAGAPRLTAKIVAHAVEKVAPPDQKNVVQLRRCKEVTLPVADPERAVRILLKSCEQRDLVKLYSELGFTLHRIGAITKWAEAMRAMLARKDVA